MMVYKYAESNTVSTTLTRSRTSPTNVIAGYQAYTGGAQSNTVIIGHDDFRDIVDRVSALEKIQPSQLIKVENCPNCGGEMKMYAEDHILKCCYCKSVVFVGVKNVNG